VLWLLLAGWVLPHIADRATTEALLARGSSHEHNPFQATLLARVARDRIAGAQELRPPRQHPDDQSHGR
jgi:hypothetical protein